MDLGAFSISLPVKDLAKSAEFYRKIGFVYFGGNADHGYLILKNGDNIIGLFQGMFEKPMLTFNPGWDQKAQNLDTFTDVRDLKAAFQAAGVPFDASDPNLNTDGPSGPASFVVVDPDGNPILIDQHR